MRKLTTKERILLHLFDYNRFADEYTVPPEVTQTGVAQAAGFRVHHFTQYTKPLVADGSVEEDTRHILERTRRRKAYFLTVSGRHRAASLRSSLLGETVPYRTLNGVVRRLPLSEVYQEHRRGTPILALLGELERQGHIAEVRGTAQPGLVDFTEEAPTATSFVGREEELATAFQALGEVPLVLVTGMAGVGKSTLGARICDEFRGEQSLFWRDVRSWDTATDLALGLGGFLAALGRDDLQSSIRGTGPTDLRVLEEGLEEDLAGLRALLVFDDLHHAAGDAEDFFAILMEVLPTQEGISTLLLSREVPDFYSRRDVALEGTVKEIPLTGLDVESSRSLLRNAGIDEAVLDAAVQVGAGNPLFLKLLTQAAPTAAGRARTLDAYIAEEIEPGLTTAERRCLEAASLYRLPVPASGLLLERGVGRGTLLGLTRNGILDQIETGRYALHDALRSYIGTGLSQERAKDLTGLVVPWLQARAEEAADRGDPEEGIPYLGNAVAIDPNAGRTAMSLEALGRLRRVVGDYPGAIEAYDKALEKTEDPSARARLHRKTAACYAAQGDLERAEREIRYGLALISSGPSLERASLLHQRAAVAFRRQDYDACLEDVERALAWLRELPRDPDLYGYLTNTRALVHLEDPGREDAALAQTDLEEAAQAFEAIGNRRGLSLVYNNLGIAALDLGRGDEALAHLDRSSSLAEATGDVPAQEMALFTKASCLMDVFGKYEEAEALYQETFQLAKRTHQRQRVVWHHKYFAELQRRQGRYEEAQESLDYFLRHSEDLINAETRVQHLGLMARLWVRLEDAKEAEKVLLEAIDLAGTAPTRIADVSIAWARAILEGYRGQTEAANQAFERAIKRGETDERGELLLDYGKFLVAAGREREAREVLLQARDELEHISKAMAPLVEEELKALEVA